MVTGSAKTQSDTKCQPLLRGEEEVHTQSSVPSLCVSDQTAPPNLTAA